MLQVEELVDVILAEEGQTLMGLEFLVDTLKLSMDKIEKIFIKSAKEYAQRRPFYESVIMTNNPLVLPKGTIMVRAVRYGVMPEIPRWYFPTFTEIGYELTYDYTTGHKQVFCKVWPPIYPIRVTYGREYTITNSNSVIEDTFTVEGENEIEFQLKGTPRLSTLLIAKGTDTMKMSGTGEEIIINEDGDEVPMQVTYLEGTLGSGYLINKTRKLILTLNNTDEGTVQFTYYPKYRGILELEIGNYVFTKLFASKLLESLASLRAQATQTDLHHIDLTTDDLYARVRSLKAEVARLLRTTISYGDMADI